MRAKLARGADPHPVPDHHVRADPCTGADLDVGPEHRVRIDRHARTELPPPRRAAPSGAHREGAGATDRATGAPRASPRAAARQRCEGRSARRSRPRAPGRRAPRRPATWRTRPGSGDRRRMTSSSCPPPRAARRPSGVASSLPPAPSATTRARPPVSCAISSTVSPDAGRVHAAYYLVGDLRPLRRGPRGAWRRPAPGLLPRAPALSLLPPAWRWASRGGWPRWS